MPLDDDKLGQFLKSNAGAADAGLVVFWELWEPLP